MKNIFRILMAVAVLFTASCAKEDISSSIVGGGEVEVTFTANLPELGTRAYGNGANADILYYNVFDAATDELLENISGSVPGSKAFTVNIPMLKGMTYDIVFWAQKNTSDYYKLEGKELTVKYDADKKNANDNDRDAFYAYVAGFDPTKAKSNDTQISLYRPFAQLNAAVVNSDIEAVGENEVNLTTSTVTVDTYTSFDISTGDVIGNKSTVTFDATTMPCYRNPAETLKDGYKYLSMNYILVPKAGMVSNVTFTFNNDKNIDFGTSYNDVPFKQNFRTNILGALLTAPTQFTVEIEEEFYQPDQIPVNVADAQELLQALADPDINSIVLSDDIDLNDLLASLGTSSTRAAAPLPIVIPENKSIDLDLNGCKINAPFVEGSNSKHYYAFENRGTLTIKDTKGNGEINARGNFNYGTMTLESGTINAIDGDGGYGVRNYAGKFTMNGGTIATTLEDDHKVDKGGYDATTLRVDEGATAVINGGTINNICDYTFAIDNYGNTTVKGGTFTSIHSTVSTYGVMTIDGGTFTCNGLESVTAHALVAWDGSETTINGGTFDGKDNYNGFNVDACEGANVVIKGGNFLPVHSGSLYGEGTITVSGGTFFDPIPTNRLATGYKSVENTDGTYTATFFPANVSTAAELLDAVAEGGYIILTADVTVSETIAIPEGVTATLDLNGKTITGTMHKSVGAVIKNEGTLTINGGTISSTAENGGSAVQNSGTLVVENATLNGAPNANSSWPSYTVNNTGVMTVNDSKITSVHGAVASYNDGAVLTLNNCEIDMSGIPGFTSHGMYTYSNGKIVVNGGTYANKATDQVASGASVINGAVEVNAGTFSGRIENYYGTPVLKGGTYSVKPNANFVADGYKALEDNGKYVIVPEKINGVASTPIVNKNGETYTGDAFASGYMDNALLFQNWIFSGDATIIVENKTYGAIILDNVKGSINGNAIEINNDNNSVMILQDVEYTLTEGKKLIKSEKTIYQVFMSNIIINGVKQTQESIAQYLENVGWYQVVDEI